MKYVVSIDLPGSYPETFFRKDLAEIYRRRLEKIFPNNIVTLETVPV